MSRVTRRLDRTVQEIKELVNMAVVVEQEPSLVAAALNQISWHLFDARRALAKDLRASGRSWAQIGATMGISKQSAMRQWGAVDGELLANIAAGYRPRDVLRAHDRARYSRSELEPVVQVEGQLPLTDR